AQLIRLGAAIGAGALLLLSAELSHACQPNNDGRVICRDGAAPAKQAIRGGHVTYLPHPSGCPRRSFCGCGASVRVFGKPVRNLCVARIWFRLPHARCAPSTVAARRSHVFVIDRCYGAGTVLASDFNSGGLKSRRHRRSLKGFAIVSPTTQTYHA